MVCKPANFLRLCANGNVFERFHFRSHAKMVSNTVNLPWTLKLKHIEYIFPWILWTGRQNDKLDKNDYENARKRRSCAQRLN